MSDVNVQLVREFFELNAFHVMTNWRHDGLRARGADHGCQLFVENTAPAPERELDFVLRAGDLPVIRRALVDVRAWHADRFYPSVIESNPILFQIVDKEFQARAKAVFGGAEGATILVISELPSSSEPRQRSLTLLQEGGIGHVIEFPTVIHEVLNKISAQVSYSTSQTLQTLRLLKRYSFIRRQQLELPFPTEAPLPTVPPMIETIQMSGDEEIATDPD